VRVHFHAAETSGLAHDVSDGIVGARAGRQPVRYHPDTFESLRIFDNLWRSVAVFLLHSFPCRGGLIDMTVGGDQLEFDHLLLLASWPVAFSFRLLISDTFR